MGRFVEARKSLGQNFLHDPACHKKIRDCIQRSSQNHWLEIGCGTGEITKHFAQMGKSLTGVELDDRLIGPLESIFESMEEGRLVHQSILDLSEQDLELPGAYSILGNLPYYITSPILEHVLQNYKGFDDFYLMVQKEVGDRIVSAHGSKTYGRLSLFVQLHCEARKCFDVKRGCFQPAPKVDSVFLHLKKRQQVPALEVRETLLKLAKIAFSQRRKKMAKLLKNVHSGFLWEECLEDMGKSPNSRAQELSVEDFLELTGRFLENSSDFHSPEKKVE